MNFKKGSLKNVYKAGSTLHPPSDIEEIENISMSTAGIQTRVKGNQGAFSL